MMVQDIPGSGITFRTYHLADCFIQENDKGFVDTLYRKYKNGGFLCQKLEVLEKRLLSLN